MDIRKPVSFYNGFFPFGYAALLRMLSFGRPLYAPFIYNALFGTVCLYGIIFLGALTMDPHWVLLAIMGLSLFPKFFRYALTPGTDIGMTAFTMSGATLLLWNMVMEQSGAGSAFSLFFGGVLLGFAALWRYHGSVLALAFIIGTTIFSVSPAWTFFIASAGFLTVYSSQMAFNVLSGHGPLESAQSFQIHIMMYGVDWHKTSSVKVPLSMIEVILGSPGRFIKNYIPSFLEVAPLLLPSLLCVFLLDDNVVVRLNGAIGISAFIYLVVAAMGRSHSERAEIPLLPVIAYQVALLLKLLTERLFEVADGDVQTVIPVLVAVAAAAFLYIYKTLRANQLSVRQWRRINMVFRDVETILIKDGMKTPDQLFSTAHSLYFPSLYPYYPFHRVGGYGRDSTYKFNDEYPEMNAGTIDELVTDCRGRGITHVVLTPNCDGISTELGDLYDEKMTTGRLLQIGSVYPFKIYRVSDG